MGAMGKTRRYSPDCDAASYSQVPHRIARGHVARLNLAAQLVELVPPPEPETVASLELPGEDEVGGIARERMLDLLQVVGEQLVAAMYMAA
jgi:hypothetical protein